MDQPNEIKLNIKNLICSKDQVFFELCQKREVSESYDFLKDYYNLCKKIDTPPLQDSIYSISFFGYAPFQSTHQPITENAICKEMKKLCKTYIIPSENDFASDKKTINISAIAKDKLILFYQENKPNLTDFRKTLDSAATEIESLLKQNIPLSNNSIAKLEDRKKTKRSRQRSLSTKDDTPKKSMLKRRASSANVKPSQIKKAPVIETISSIPEEPRTNGSLSQSA